MKGVLLNDNHIFAEITREIHIIDDFKVKMLIKVDILTLKRMIINFVTQSIKISNYRNMIILINSRARSEPIKRAVKSFSKIILLSHTITSISIAYAETLLKNKNLFFEPQYLLSLNHASEIYVYIINTFFREMHVRNDIN